MEQDATTTPLSATIVAACEDCLDACKRGRGFMVTNFRLRTRTGIIVQRGKGGLLQLFRVDSSSQTRDDEVEVEGTYDPGLYEAMATADARALPDDMDMETIRTAQQIIWTLTTRDRDRLPDVGTQWSPAWGRYLGQVLEDGGYTDLGRNRLNWRTLGWLEALEATQIMEESGV